MLLLNFSFHSVEHHKNHIGCSSNGNYLSTTTFTLRGTLILAIKQNIIRFKKKVLTEYLSYLDDTRQIEQLNFSSFILNHAWHTCQCSKLICSYHTLRGCNRAEQSRLAYRWKTDQSNTSIARFHYIEAFAFAARFTGILSAHYYF